MLAAGLAGLSVAGLVPGSPTWVAYAGLVALVSGVMLLAARLLRLGFIGDFLSASVLVGFLSGVGVQVFSGQIPDMLGISKGSGGWLQQQWHVLTSLTQANVRHGRVRHRHDPRDPGLQAVHPGGAGRDRGRGGVHRAVRRLGSARTASRSSAASPAATAVRAAAGSVRERRVDVTGIAFSCFVLVIAQSAATSRSFAVRHGQRVDINRDIIGLAGREVAAGLTGTFVVNGSPTKTQILDGQKGRTQVANLTMSAVVVIVLLFFTGVLSYMPLAVLAAIVFLIGVELIDVAGLRRIYRQRMPEFVIAALTAVVVVLVGSSRGSSSRSSRPRRDDPPPVPPLRLRGRGGPAGQSRRTPLPSPGSSQRPGLIVFRYDADLFYANANRFTDHVQAVVEKAPDPVRWLVLDCSVISDIDYSAAQSLARLRDYLHARQAALVVAGADDAILAALRTYGLLDTIRPEHVVPTVLAAMAAFRASNAAA